MAYRHKRVITLIVLVAVSLFSGSSFVLSQPASVDVQLKFNGIWVNDKKECRQGIPGDEWWWIGKFSFKKTVNYYRKENIRDVLWNQGGFGLVSNTTMGCTLYQVREHGNGIIGNAKCDWDTRPTNGKMRLVLVSSDELVIYFENTSVDFNSVHKFRCG